MYITLRMSNNKKITAQPENILYLNPCVGVCADALTDGKIIVNADHIIYVRPARDEEIKHAELHGW